MSAPPSRFVKIEPTRPGGEVTALAKSYWARDHEGHWVHKVARIAEALGVAPQSAGTELAKSVRATIPGLVCAMCTKPVLLTTRQEVEALEAASAPDRKCGDCLAAAHRRDAQAAARLLTEQESRRQAEIQRLRGLHRFQGNVDRLDLKLSLSFLAFTDGPHRNAPIRHDFARTGDGVFASRWYAVSALRHLFEAGLLLPSATQPPLPAGVRPEPAPLRLPDLTFDRPDPRLIELVRQHVAEIVGQAAVARDESALDYLITQVGAVARLVALDDLCATLTADVESPQGRIEVGWDEKVQAVMHEHALRVPQDALRGAMFAALRFIRVRAATHQDGGPLQPLLAESIKRNIGWFLSGTHKFSPVSQGMATSAFVNAVHAAFKGSTEDVLRLLEARAEGDRAAPVNIGFHARPKPAFGLAVPRPVAPPQPPSVPKLPPQLHGAVILAMAQALAAGRITDERCLSLLREFQQ